MKMEKSIVNKKRFVSISSHPTKFWTGETVNGSSELSKLTTLMDESLLLKEEGEFELIQFKKSLSWEGEQILAHLIEDGQIDYILVPAMFSSVDLSSLPKRGKLVAYNATNETSRLSPSEKIASNRLTLIW